MYVRQRYFNSISLPTPQNEVEQQLATIQQHRAKLNHELATLRRHHQLSGNIRLDPEDQAVLAATPDHLQQFYGTTRRAPLFSRYISYNNVPLPPSYFQPVVALAANTNATATAATVATASSSTATTTTNDLPNSARIQAFRQMADQLRDIYQEPHWNEQDSQRLWQTIQLQRRIQLLQSVLKDPRYIALYKVKLGDMDVAQLTIKEELRSRIDQIDALSAEQLVVFGPQEMDWEVVAFAFEEKRTAMECCTRWYQVEIPTLNKQPWTKEEDTALLKLVREEPNKTWAYYAEKLGTKRTQTQALMRYQQSLNPDALRGKWTQEEDEALAAAVQRHGDLDWLAVEQQMPHRTHAQCMHRWLKSADPCELRETIGEN